MATIKSFTDLLQSKKLAEILPLESADFFWLIGRLHTDGPRYQVIRTRNEVSEPETCWPCWSLAALLSVLPFHLIIDNQRYEFSMKKGLNKNGETYAIKYTIFNTTFYLHLTDYYNNPIDACYEMVLKLHEQKIL